MIRPHPSEAAIVKEGEATREKLNRLIADVEANLKELRGQRQKLSRAINRLKGVLR